MQDNSRSARRVWWALGVVCLAGFGLRVYALGYGLPGVYNPDEMPILNRALALRNDPNPHNFLYPSLQFYALFAWEVAFFIVGRVVGLYQSLDAFQQEYFRDPSRLILAGRALTVACGTVSLLAVYRFGARLYGQTTGVIAALFLAVSPFAVRDAHYIKLDIPVTMLTAMAHAVLARIVVDPIAAGRRRTWLLAGFLAGLAMSTQYYVLFLVAPMVGVAVADLRRSGRWQTSAGLLIMAGLATIAGFLVGSPFFIVELPTAMRDIAGVRAVDIDRALASGGGMFSSLMPYLRMLAIDAMGWPVALAAAIGAVLALVTDWRRGLLLIAFPIAYLAFIAHTVPMSRYLDAMLPMVAVAGAFACAQIAARAKSHATLVTLLLATAVAGPGLLSSIKSDVFFSRTDTRTLAREFIEREVPDGASVLTQPYSAPIRMSRESLIEALRANLGDESRAGIKFRLQLALSPYPSPAYRTIYFGDGGSDKDKLYVLPTEFDAGTGLAPLRGRRIEYVVLKLTNVPNPETAALQAALQREARLLATFSPYRTDADAATRAAVSPFFHNTAARIDPALERPGPIVEIWQVAGR